MASIGLTTVRLLFGVGFLGGGIVLGGLLVSIFSPSRRFWPHGDRNWAFWLGWTAWILYFGSLLGVAYLDWRRSYELPTLVDTIGLLMMVTGGAICIWAVWHLGLRESSGLEGRLDTDGPYRYSRNPQYVSYIAILLGVIILAGSWMVTALALVGIVWFLLAPLAEEPWLHDQYGDAYDAYHESVPRFVGRTHQPPSLSEQTNGSNGRNP